MNRKEKEEKLKLLIEKSILMDEEDSDYWLGKMPGMPDVILDGVIAAIEKKNAIAEGYIKEELKNDKNGESLEGLRELVKSARTKAVAMEERFQGGRAEEDILKQLETI